MAYKNQKTGQDECPQTKRQHLADMVKVGNTLLAEEITQGNTQAQEYYVPVHGLSAMFAGLDDSDLDAFNSANIKKLADHMGIPRCSSGVYGCERVATEMMKQQYPNAHITLGDKSKMNRWGYYIDGAKAYNCYMKWLKYCFEFVLARPI